LDVPGEAQFVGKGVTYCGVCDGPRFQDKVVAVVGGGNSAIAEALHLTRFATRVIVIHRRKQLRAIRALQQKAKANEKITFCYETKVVTIIGNEKLEGLELVDISKDEKAILPVGGVLIRIGLEPNTSFLRGLISLDDMGYVLTNEELGTNVPGIFAAGDIRHGSCKQIAAAVGDGATAAISASNVLNLKY
jgi:thioredoxin reductase (NADPH)